MDKSDTMEPTQYFGAKAGRVWNSLKHNGPQTLTQLQKTAGLTVKEVSMGLGWLAKEGKIRLKDFSDVSAKYELND